MRKPNEVYFIGTTVIFVLERRDGSRLECTADLADYPLLKNYRWCVGSGGIRRTVYAKTRVTDDKQIRMHQFIMGVLNVDHKDNNGLNNTRNNLRPSTQSQNVANADMRTSNKSGFKGVSWNKRNKTWRAVIMVHGKQIYLGKYSEKISAAKAYDEAAKKYFGEFSKTNF